MYRGEKKNCLRLWIPYLLDYTVFPNYVHKDNVPIRPVVSFIDAPTYNLCIFLDSWFTSFTNFRPKFSIKNTFELVDRIKDFPPPPGSLLVSFDVVNLYTNVPLQPSFDYIYHILSDLSIPPSIIQGFLTLLRTCLMTNICFLQIF